MATDLVIGATSGYEFETLRPWVRSLERSGFNGRKVVLVGNGRRELLDALTRRGYEVVTRAVTADGDAYHPDAAFRDEDVSVERFGWLWAYLSGEPRARECRYVIAVDTRDAVFQADPARWLEANLGDKELCVSSEAVTYADEPWNRQSLLDEFGPAVHRHLLDGVVWNAGVIGGTAAMVRDLCLNVHLLCRASRAHYGDQAAVNVSLSMEPFRRLTRFAASEDGWACHAGTMFDPAMNGHRREPQPVFDGEVVSTRSGRRYCVVHQYDRVPEWNQMLRQRYGHVTADDAADR